VIIERATDTRRATGGVSQAWSVVWQGHAGIRGRGARAILAQEQVSEQRRAVFEMRYNRLVDSGMRIRVLPDGVWWQIEAIDDPEGMKRRQLLTCSRAVDTI